MAAPEIWMKVVGNWNWRITGANFASWHKAANHEASSPFLFCAPFFSALNRLSERHISVSTQSNEAKQNALWQSVLKYTGIVKAHTLMHPCEFLHSGGTFIVQFFNNYASPALQTSLISGKESHESNCQNWKIDKLENFQPKDQCPPLIKSQPEQFKFK